MKQALISPQEKRETGYRVAQVVDDGNQFEVASPLFWVDCADNIVADEFWYDPSSNTIKILPQIMNYISPLPDDKTIAQVETNLNHNLTTGQLISLTGQIPELFSGQYTVNVTSPNTFTYNLNEIATDSATTVGIYDVLD